MRNPIGTHVLVGKGLVAGALANADELGCETIQIFVGNPRGWALSPGQAGRGRARSATGCAERGHAGLHPRAVPGEPRLARPPRRTRSRSPRSPTTCAGPPRSAPRAWSCTPARTSTPTAARTARRRDGAGARGAAAAAGRGRRTTPRRGCCSSRRPARAGRCARASRTSSRTSPRSTSTPRPGSASTPATSSPPARRWTSPAARPPRRPDRRDRRARPAAAGPRQRLDGRARRVQGPAPEDRRGPHRRERVRASCSPTRRPTGCRSSSRPPARATRTTRDIPLLKKLAGPA